MNQSGGADLLVAARSALLDALEALHDHRDAVVVIGAQAIYLHTGAAPVALAEATKDCDLALDTRQLPPHPLLEEAMHRAGFHLDVQAHQPGAWLNPDGIPVDLMVPDALAGGAGRRGARIPPHSKNAARRAVGLEATVVDHAVQEVGALSPDDGRCYTANVAGPAALLVAKLHKLGERQVTPSRLLDKDAHDIYRLLVAVATDRLGAAMRRLWADPLAGQVTELALGYLSEMFGEGPDALGSRMAGRAEEGIGEPATVSAAVAALAQDLLAEVGANPLDPAG
jgi:hypothetical protein